MGAIKISYKPIERYQAKRRKQSVRKGYCKICGGKLTNEKSIDRGIGQRCLSHNAMIIMEFVPDNPEIPA